MAPLRAGIRAEIAGSQAVPLEIVREVSEMYTFMQRHESRFRGVVTRFQQMVPMKRKTTLPPGRFVRLRPLKPTVKIKGLSCQLERLTSVTEGSWVATIQWRRREDRLGLRGFPRACVGTSMPSTKG